MSSKEQEREQEHAMLLKSYGNNWIKDVDWDNPLQKNIDDLHSELESRSESFIESIGAEEFVDDPEQYIEENGVEELADFADALYNEPIDMNQPLDVSEKVIVSVQLCTGGPGFDLEFVVDPETGECETGYSVFKDWGVSRKELSENDLERFSKLFEYKFEEIAERYQQRDSMRHGY